MNDFSKHIKPRSRRKYFPDYYYNVFKVIIVSFIYPMLLPTTWNGILDGLVSIFIGGLVIAIFGYVASLIPNMFIRNWSKTWLVCTILIALATLTGNYYSILK